VGSSTALVSVLVRWYHRLWKQVLAHR
jgi:hypothetical protein